MIRAFRSAQEAELLDTAIDLFKRSASCSVTEPFLSRQYAQQAYRLGAYSERIRRLITEERVRMIRQEESDDSGSHVTDRILHYLDTATTRGRSRLRPLSRKLNLLLVVFLMSMLAVTTSINEAPPEKRVATAAWQFGAHL